MDSIERDVQENGVCFDGGQESDEFHYREEEPQGLLYFTRYDSVPIMVDALFDSPPSREFTQSELASKADLSSKTVSDRIEVLYELGVIKPVEETNRFSLDLDGVITWKLRELDGLIKQAQGSSGSPRRFDEEPRGVAEEKTPVDEPEDAINTMQRIQEQVTSSGRHAD